MWDNDSWEVGRVRVYISGNLLYCDLQVGCLSALPAKLHKTIFSPQSLLCGVQLAADNQPAKHNTCKLRLSLQTNLWDRSQLYSPHVNMPAHPCCIPLPSPHQQVCTTNRGVLARSTLLHSTALPPSAGLYHQQRGVGSLRFMPTGYTTSLL